MERIEKENINISNLEVLKERKKKNNVDRGILVTHDNKRVYKFFDCDSKKYMGEMQKRIELLGDENYDRPLLSVFPDEEIFDGDKFVGYTQEYIPDAVSLNDVVMFDDKDLYDFVRLSSKASEILDYIHGDFRGIVLCDMNFTNIIISKKDKYKIPYFIDFDDCAIGGRVGPTAISANLNAFLKDKGLPRVVSQETDKISMAISFFNIIFGTNNFAISLYDFDMMCEKYPFLEDMRDLFKSLKSERCLYGIDYLHDVIDPDKLGEGKKLIK